MSNLAGINYIDGILKNGYSFKFASIKDFNVLTGKNGCSKSQILLNIYNNLGYIFEKIHDVKTGVDLTDNNKFFNNVDNCFELNGVEIKSASPNFNLEVKKFEIESKSKKLCFPLIFKFNTDSIIIAINDSFIKDSYNSLTTISLKYFRSIDLIIKYLVIRKSNCNYKEENEILIDSNELNKLEKEFNDFLAYNNFEHKIFLNSKSKIIEDKRVNYLDYKFGTTSNINKIDVSDFSSGERFIFLSLLWKYLHKEKIKLNNRYTCVILLDEPDSHLNQSAIENFMFIIQEDLVKGLGCQVVMTTHNLMTANYFDDSDVLCVEKKEKIVTINSYSYSLGNSILADNLYLGIKKGKICNPAVLEDIITNTEGLIYKDYGTPIENLIKSFLLTSKVDTFLTLIGVTEKDEIYHKDIYSLTDVEQLEIIYTGIKKTNDLSIIWPLNPNNERWDFMILKKKELYFFQVTVRIDINTKINQTLGVESTAKNVASQGASSSAKFYSDYKSVFDNFDKKLEFKYYLIHSNIKNNVKYQERTININSIDKKIKINLISTKELGDSKIFDSKLLREIKGEIFQIRYDLKMNQNSTKLNEYFQSMCHGKIEDIPYIFTYIEKKTIFDEIKKAQDKNEPLVVWINNPVKLKSGSNMVEFFYFNGSATSLEILIHLITEYESGSPPKEIEDYFEILQKDFSNNLKITASGKVTFIVLEMKILQEAGAQILLSLAKRDSFIINLISSSEEITKLEYQIKFFKLTENYSCSCGSNAKTTTICKNHTCKCKKLYRCCIKGKWHINKNLCDSKCNNFKVEDDDSSVVLAATPVPTIKRTLETQSSTSATEASDSNPRTSNSLSNQPTSKKTKIWSITS